MKKPIYWDDSKNQKLLNRYGIGFEEVVIALEQEKLLDDKRHPNQEKYQHQRQLVVNIEGYAYVVPYVEDEQHYFFKTLFPSRVATRHYLTGKPL